MNTAFSAASPTPGANQTSFSADTDLLGESAALTAPDFPETGVVAPDALDEDRKGRPINLSSEDENQPGFIAERNLPKS